MFCFVLFVFKGHLEYHVTCFQNNWMQSVASTWLCQSRGNWCSYCDPQPARYRLFLTASCISFRNAGYPTVSVKGAQGSNVCQYETTRAVCWNLCVNFYFLNSITPSFFFAAKSERHCIGLKHRGYWRGMFEAQHVDRVVSQDTLQVWIRSRGVTIRGCATTSDDSRLQQSNLKLQMSLERLWTYQQRVFLGSCKNSVYPAVMNYYSSRISRFLQGYLNATPL